MTADTESARSDNGAPTFVFFKISGMVGVFAIAVGATPVLLGVLMSRSGMEPTLIGLSAGLSPLGMIAAAFLAPPLAAKIGAVRTAIGSCALGLLSVAAMAIIQEDITWIVARLFWGVSVGSFYIINKAWLAEVTPEGVRGRVFGVYTAILSAGFASGPLLVSLLDFAATISFLIIAAVFCVCMVLVSVLSPHLPPFQKKRPLPVLSAFPLIPIPILAAVSFGAFDHVVLTFLPTFGAHFGSSEVVMGVGLSVLNVGSVVLQPGIGWVSDRWGRQATLLWCALATAAGSLLLNLTVGSILIYPFLMLWGAFAYGVATVGLAWIGDKFSGGQLLSCSAAITMAGGLGGVCGPLLFGAVQDAAGIGSLPLFIGGIYGVLALTARLLKTNSAT